MTYYLAEPRRGMHMEVARFQRSVIDIARIAAQGDVEQLIQHVPESLTQEAGASLAQVWTHDDVSTRLRLRASDGTITPPPGQQDEVHLQQAPPPFWVETVVGMRQPLIQNDLVDDARFDQKWVAGEKIAGVAALPITYAGHLFGALILISREEVDPETADMIEAIASIIAMAMHASQLAESRETAVAHAQRAEATLGAALHASPVPIFDLTPFGNVRRCNPAAERILGWKRHDLLGRPLPMTLEEGDLSELHERVRAGESITDIEGRWDLPDDSVRDVSLSVAPVTGDNQINGITAVLQDITERKSAERALRESEERFRELFENAHDVMFTIDLRGKFTSLNRAAEQVSGYTRQEAASMSISDILAPEDLALAREMLERKSAENLPTIYPLHIVARDGAKVPLELSTQFIMQGGTPVGVQGIGRDMRNRPTASEWP